MREVLFDNDTHENRIMLDKRMYGLRILIEFFLGCAIFTLAIGVGVACYDLQRGVIIIFLASLFYIGLKTVLYAAKTYRKEQKTE